MNGLSVSVCMRCMWCVGAAAAASLCRLLHALTILFVALIHCFINDAHTSHDQFLREKLLLLLHFVVAYNFINKYHFSLALSFLSYTFHFVLFSQRLATKTERFEMMILFFHSKAHIFWHILP